MTAVRSKEEKEGEGANLAACVYMVLLIYNWQLEREEAQRRMQ